MRLALIVCCLLFGRRAGAEHEHRAHREPTLAFAKSHLSSVRKQSLVFNTPPGAADYSSKRELKEDPLTGLVDDLVYISDREAAAKLGCPVNHSFACFYRFDNSEDDLTHWVNDTLTLESCHMVFKPLDPDNGRPWCIRKGRAAKWLGSLDTWNIPGIVMQVGSLDGPNPTHQANLHFMHIWRWMRKAGVLAGQLQLMCDSENKKFTPGKYGEGLANALGSIEWLQHLPPGVIAFERIRFSIPDVPLTGFSKFPFWLRRSQINMAADVQFVELAENVKLRLSKRYLGDTFDLEAWSSNGYKSPPILLEETEVDRKSQLHAVIAQRRIDETRYWANAEDLVQELELLDMNVTLATMGDLSFDEQVQLVSSTDVLVGAHGSDLVNLMFLPMGGSLVEIFPKLHGRGMFIPELPNMAHLLAKGHFLYISNGPIESDTTVDREVSKVISMNVSAADIAPLIHLAAYQARKGFNLERIVCKYSSDYQNVNCSDK